MLRACRICDIMQVVCKELTPDGVKLKVSKSKFDWYKISKHVRIAMKIDLSSIKLHVEFFQYVGLCHRNLGCSLESGISSNNV